jgi:hypothetical protein
MVDAQESGGRQGFGGRRGSRVVVGDGTGFRSGVGEVGGEGLGEEQVIDPGLRTTVNVRERNWSRFKKRWRRL